MYLSLGISFSCSFITVSALFCCEFFKTSVILSAILLLIKSPVASALLNYSFWRSFKCIYCRLLAWSSNFWLYLPLNPKTAGGGGVGVWGDLLTNPCGFLKNVFSKERVNPWLFASFNIIINTSFLKISLTFLKSFRRYEELLCEY